MAEGLVQTVGLCPHRRLILQQPGADQVVPRSEPLEDRGGESRPTFTVLMARQREPDHARQQRARFRGDVITPFAERHPGRLLQIAGRFLLTSAKVRMRPQPFEQLCQQWPIAEGARLGYQRSTECIAAIIFPGRVEGVDNRRSRAQRLDTPRGCLVPRRFDGTAQQLHVGAAVDTRERGGRVDGARDRFAICGRQHVDQGTHSSQTFIEAGHAQVQHLR